MGFDAAARATGDETGRSSAFAPGSDHRHAPSTGGAGATGGLGIPRADIRGGLHGWSRSAALADAADGGASESKRSVRIVRPDHHAPPAALGLRFPVSPDVSS